MKTQWTLSLAVMLAMVLFLAAAPVSRADDIPALKIAICNPVKVATQIQEYKDLNDKLKGEKATIEEELAHRREKIKAMQDELKLLLPDTKEFTDKDKAYLNYSIETDAWTKFNELDLNRTQKNMTRSIFDKINKEVAQLAQERGITLVLSDKNPQIPDNLDDVPVETLTAAILQRSILYADPKFDITQDVVIALDKAYSSSH